MLAVRKVFSIFAILFAVFCLVAQTSGFSVDLYERKHFKGIKTTVEVGKGCQDITTEWDDIVSSVHPKECVVIYKHPKCQGPRVRLEPWTFGTAHLDEINFEDKISSISPCSFVTQPKARDEH